MGFLDKVVLLLLQMNRGSSGNSKGKPQPKMLVCYPMFGKTAILDRNNLLEYINKREGKSHYRISVNPCFYRCALSLKIKF